MTSPPDATPPPLSKVIDSPELDGGQPVDSDVLDRAALFMSTVRQIQRESGRSLNGKMFLSAETRAASNEAMHHPILLARPPRPFVAAAAQRRAFVAFEEMCRRRHMPLQPDLRPAVYRLLCDEMAFNNRLFRLPPKSLASVTVYNGSLKELAKAYPAFRDVPFVFRRAAMNNPSDPKAFLEFVQRTVARLEQDERFASFRDRPFVFREAAVRSTSDPEAFLLTLFSSGPQESASAKRKRECATKLERLRQKIQKGLESGPATSLDMDELKRIARHRIASAGHEPP